MKFVRLAAVAGAAAVLCACATPTYRFEPMAGEGLETRYDRADEGNCTGPVQQQHRRTHRAPEARERSERAVASPFERLSTTRVSVPPLRDRTGDIPALARHLLAEKGAPQ